MCPAIGKVVSSFQLVAPSVITSLCDYRAVQELTGKLVRWGVLEKEVPIPSLLEDFSSLFRGDAAFCLEHLLHVIIRVNNIMTGCACK